MHLCICVFAVYAQYYSCYWASWPLCNSAPPPDALLPKHSLHFQFIPIVFFLIWAFLERVFKEWSIPCWRVAIPRMMLRFVVIECWVKGCVRSETFLQRGFLPGRMSLFPWWPFFLRVSADFKDFATTGDLSTYTSPTNKSTKLNEKQHGQKVVISKNEIIWIANLSENRKIATRSQVVISKNVWIATLRAFWGNLNCSGRLFSEPDLSPFELTSKQSFSIY